LLKILLLLRFCLIFWRDTWSHWLIILEHIRNDNVLFSERKTFTSHSFVHFISFLLKLVNAPFIKSSPTGHFAKKRFFNQKRAFWNLSSLFRVFLVENCTNCQNPVLFKFIELLSSRVMTSIHFILHHRILSLLV
jgi:hypothetical protein